jgi:phosphoenolpyruvate carboxylase
MEQMAAHSRSVYQALVYEDAQFWEFYTQATPIAHISQLPITSRPAMRGGGKLAGLDELRAIPWVFAWVQSRYVVPGWYGLGAALEEFASRDEASLQTVRDMYETWPFFRTVIDNAQLELVRAHLPTAAFYAGRVQPASLAKHFHEQLAQEYQRACKWVLSVTRQKHMLDSSPVVQATVRMRNPVVLPLNKLQVQLMNVWDHLPESERDANGPWREPLLLSITSIAAGMQSTG